MEAFFPEQLIAYFPVFCQAFSRPNFVYFQSFVWALLLVEGRKCTSRIARACFFVDRTLGSFERFLAEYHWDLNQVIACLVKLLIQTLKDKLQKRRGYKTSDFLGYYPGFGVSNSKPYRWIACFWGSSFTCCC